VAGSVVTVLPSGCVPVVIGNISYEQCGTAWFKPQYTGTTVQYIVVNAPQ
jgi:hypothetical protein